MEDVSVSPAKPKYYTPLDNAMNSYVSDIECSYGNGTRMHDFAYSDFFKDKMLIIQSIKKGMPYNLFSFIKGITPFSDSDWANFLNISLKTLYRSKKEDSFTFKPIHTEKIIEIAEVTNFGKEVFDSMEQFYTWLKTPSFALGNYKPVDLLENSYGKEMVMGELNRIEHGIFV